MFQNSKLLILIVVFIFLYEKILFFEIPKKNFPQQSERVKLPAQKWRIESEGYFINVSVSTISLAAEKKCKKELNSLIIYNSTNECLTRLTPIIKTEFNFLSKDLIKKKISMLSKKQMSILKSVINILKKKEILCVRRCANGTTFKNVKEKMENYLKEIIRTNFRKIKKKTKTYCAKTLKYLKNKDYESYLFLLENISILNKNFPLNLILYLQVEGKLTEEIIG